MAKPIDVMEIDMNPDTQDRILEANPKDKQTLIDIDISSNVKPLSADLQIFNAEIDVKPDSNKNTIEIELKEGGGKKKVYTDDVYFKDDVQAAGEYTQVGNITKSKDESINIETKGKTLADFIRMVFTKEIQPSKTEPSISLIFSQSGAYEVGKEINPTYNATLNPGSYTYGPPTGVTAESWSIKDSAGNTSSANIGSFPGFTVTDATNYTIQATVEHTEGVPALTNLGNESGVKIEAGTKSRTSAAVTGYRAFFYGVLESDDSTILTSDIIRALTNGGNYNGQKTFVVNANKVSNPKRIIIAIPDNTTRSGLKQVLLTSAFDTDITAQYTLLDTKINVEGLNGFTSKPYRIYQYQPAKMDAGEIHTITLG